MNAIIALLKDLLHNMLQLFSFGRKNITNTLSVCIKTNTGSTLNVDLDPKWDIGNVKRLVADELGLRADELKIIFAGKELSNSTTIEECDLGQRSVLHAVRSRASASPAAGGKRALNDAPNNQHHAEQIIEEVEHDEEEHDDDENHSTTHRLPPPPQPHDSSPNSSSSSSTTTTAITSPSKPLAATLVDLQLVDDERHNIAATRRERTRAHFYVYCSQCRALCAGKLRVRCAVCRGGAFTVHRDPECWPDVLRARRIRGLCESRSSSAVDGGEPPCIDASAGDAAPPFAEFYFKCAVHASGGETDFSAPLSLIKINIRDVPCLACTDVCETVLVFPCAAGHVTCLPCFRLYCESRLLERRFVQHPTVGYTLGCPAGCPESAIEEIHHFKLLTGEQYERYQRFATEEFVLREGGVLCPQPGCGQGLLVDEGCTRVTCVNGCGFVFCRLCLKGYHIGACLPDASEEDTDAAGRTAPGNDYAVDPQRAATARWDEASAVTIKICTKPCPKCRTPTERSGGCMHMVCTRSGCGLEWCWVCQTEWTRDCMGAHWFG